MGRVFAAVAVLSGYLVTLAIVLTMFGLVNGGLVYRTQCPTPEGTLKTDWTYKWFLPIPYLLASSEEGCETHNGTRIALAKIGVWELEEKTAAQIARDYVTEDTDPAIAYYSTVYAVISDLRRAGRARMSLDRHMALMEERAQELHALTPPASVAADHARMVNAFDQMVDLNRKGLQELAAGDEVTVSVDDLRDATADFLVLAEKIRSRLVQEATG